MSYFENEQIQQLINLSLKEDIANGDITTNNIVDENSMAEGSLLAKEDGIVAGLDLTITIFKKFDENFVFNKLYNDGSLVKKGETIATFSGTLRAILTAERTALNFLQRMSGIATYSNEFVKKLTGTKTQLLDTRKTVPGHRLLDKYAVKAGGGTNHRIGLFDMVMIKDNHIKAAGGITAAIQKIRTSLENTVKVEVETTNIDEVKEALAAGADIIMLDNMDVEAMAKAVKIIDGKAKTEASGNVTLETISNIASTNVDFISVGAITHSVKAMDISLNIKA